MRETGAVGIGTVNPETNLEVINSHDAAGTTLAQLGERAGLQLTNEDPAGNFASLRFRIDNNGADALIAGFQEGNQASSLRFYTEGTTAASQMTIQSDGNVGLGTDAPTQKLDINGTARLRQLQDSTASTNKLVVADANGVLYTMPKGTLKGVFQTSLVAFSPSKQLRQAIRW